MWFSMTAQGLNISSNKFCIFFSSCKHMVLKPQLLKSFLYFPCSKPVPQWIRMFPSRSWEPQKMMHMNSMFWLSDNWFWWAVRIIILVIWRGIWVVWCSGWLVAHFLVERTSEFYSLTPKFTFNDINRYISVVDSYINQTPMLQLLSRHYVWI